MICQLQLVTVGEHKPIKHVDMPNHPTPYFSAVYYINDSDGDTVLFDKTIDQGFDNLKIVSYGLFLK
jgi:hypothetical protein